MKSDMRKSYQRKFTKALRNINKSICEDDLWLGRFYVKQRRSSWLKFEDNSGGILYSQVRFYDKKTGYYWDQFIDFSGSSFGENRLWWNMNKFITEMSNTWREEERPSLKTAINFRNVPMIENDKREDNFYMNYEGWKSCYNENFEK